MRLFITTYAKINSGNGTGDWFDFDYFGSYDDFIAAVKATHWDEDSPEFCVSDWDGDAPNIGRHFGESMPDESEFDALKDLDELEAFDEYVGLIGPSKIDSDLKDNFFEAYQGEHQSEEDFAENLVEELGMLNDLPENLKCYFDYERFARDLFISDYSYCNGHVFRNI